MSVKFVLFMVLRVIEPLGLEFTIPIEYSINKHEREIASEGKLTKKYFIRPHLFYTLVFTK